ncbi:anti-sigma factor [Egicoccus sp. AB-alg6-2]|uniref:anti-sigma factor family protein n=1 Tax=Egicoccus sp. AB-alg6-2 TaxID=3242692 RepID=UPI00359CEDF5
MSECDEIRHALGGYVLDGLEPDERELVAAHTAVCERCRAEQAELAETARWLGALDRSTSATPTAPADLRQRVLGARRKRRGRIRLVAAAMVLSAAAGAGVATLASRPPPPDAAVALQADEPVGIVGEAQLRQLANGVEVALDLTGVRSGEQGYYHAWLHAGDVRASAGTFVGTADARARVELLCGGRLADYDRLTVTWHPAGGDDEVVALDAALDPSAAATGEPGAEPLPGW